MSRGLRYTFIGYAIGAAMVAAAVLIFTVPTLRMGAEIAFIVLLVSRLVVNRFTVRERRREIAILKTANGGALPIANPAAARVYFTTLTATTGAIGLISFIVAGFVGGSERLVPLVVGGSSLLVTALVAFTGWRLFHQRVAADRAVLAQQDEPVDR